MIDLEILELKLKRYLGEFDIIMKNNNTHFIDLETGGLQYFQSGILSSSTYSVLNKIGNNMYFRLKNQKIYSTSALEVNNIKINEINKSNDKILDLIYWFIELSKNNDYIILIGQNIENFDLSFINQAFKDYQMYNKIKPFIVIDTLTMMKDLNVKELLNIYSLSQNVVFKRLYELGYFSKFALSENKFNSLINDLHSASTDVMINMYILMYCLDVWIINKDSE